jgi:hypothetical protein
LSNEPNVFPYFLNSLLWGFWFCRYLLEHPEYTRDGVTLSQFSFQIPKPLQKNYVRKRTPLLTASHDTRPLEPGEGMQKKLPTAWKQIENPLFIINSAFSWRRESPTCFKLWLNFIQSGGGSLSHLDLRLLLNVTLETIFVHRVPLLQELWSFLFWFVY